MALVRVLTTAQGLVVMEQSADIVLVLWEPVDALRSCKSGMG